MGKHAGSEKKKKGKEKKKPEFLSLDLDLEEKKSFFSLLFFTLDTPRASLGKNTMRNAQRTQIASFPPLFVATNQPALAFGLFFSFPHAGAFFFFLGLLLGGLQRQYFSVRAAPVLLFPVGSKRA